MDSIGKRVRALRKSAGLTQAQLAERCGVNQASLSLIESDRSRAIRALTLSRLVEVLRTTPQYILFGTADDRSLEDAVERSELTQIYTELTPEQRTMLFVFARGLHLGTKSKTPLVRAIREKSRN